MTCLTSAKQNFNLLKSLGADNILEYDSKVIGRHVRSDPQLYDVVVNTNGSVGQDVCLALCNDTGKVVTKLVASPSVKEFGLFTGILLR